MRLLILLFILGSTFQACNNDNGLDDTELLNGIIGGEKWEFQYGKANSISFEDQIQIELFGLQESEIDPCAVFSSNGYLSFAIPSAEGTYNLPLIDQNESLKFHQPGVGQQFFVASSGFIEIITISGRRVGGYIQAEFDQFNIIEGTFVVDLCL